MSKEILHSLEEQELTASCLAQWLGVPECKKMNAAAVKGEQE